MQHRIWIHAQQPQVEVVNTSFARFWIFTSTKHFEMIRKQMSRSQRTLSVVPLGSGCVLGGWTEAAVSSDKDFWRVEGTTLQHTNQCRWFSIRNKQFNRVVTWPLCDCISVRVEQQRWMYGCACMCSWKDCCAFTCGYIRPGIRRLAMVQIALLYRRSVQSVPNSLPASIELSAQTNHKALCQFSIFKQF